MSAYWLETDDGEWVLGWGEDGPYSTADRDDAIKFFALEDAARMATYMNSLDSSDCWGVTWSLK